MYYIIYHGNKQFGVKFTSYNSDCVYLLRGFEREMILF